MTSTEGEETRIAADLPLFSVATHKFIVLSICTLGFYELYWCYQNWSRLRDKSGEDISPFWRAFFAPLWGFSLFGRIRDIAAAEKVPVWWSAGVLGTLYLVANFLWRLPDPWWLLSFGAVSIVVPVQQTVQRINRLHAAEGKVGNSSYSIANVITIVLGGLFVLLGIVGTLMPE